MGLLPKLNLDNVIGTVVNLVDDVSLKGLVNSLDGIDFLDLVDVLDGINVVDVVDAIDELNLPKVVDGINVGAVVDDAFAIAGELFDSFDDLNFFDDIRDLKLLNGLGDIFGTVFDDVKGFINSGEFDDLLDSLIGSPIFNGGRGDDNRLGSIARDLLFGGGGNDSLAGLNGDDLIAGGRGRDLLKGLLGNDILSGLSGDDTIAGGKGDDLISGGKGRDSLSGSGGRDTFLLEENHGLDVIKDFNIVQDTLSVLNDRDLKGVSFTQQGSNTVVSINNDAVAILSGISADKLSKNLVTVLDASSFLS